MTNSYGVHFVTLLFKKFVALSIFFSFIDVDHFLNVFIEFITMLLLLFIYFLGHKACNILAPLPGTELSPLASKGEFLTTVLPGGSHVVHF